MRGKGHAAAAVRTIVTRDRIAHGLRGDVDADVVRAVTRLELKHVAAFTARHVEHGVARPHVPADEHRLDPVVQVAHVQYLRAGVEGSVAVGERVVVVSDVTRRRLAAAEAQPRAAGARLDRLVVPLELRVGGAIHFFATWRLGIPDRRRGGGTCQIRKAAARNMVACATR